MKKGLFVFLACFSIILVGASQTPSSYGLSCAGPDLEEEFSQSRWVFLGKFISETDAGLFSDNTLMNFEVVENFKGATSPTLQVLNNPNWRHHFSDDLVLIFAGPNLFGNPELFLCTNSGDPSEESISIVRELSRDNPKIQFEKCVIGKYEKDFGLGEWKVITRDKKKDSCIMNIYWQAEADSIEYYCKVALSELKNSDWKISSFPLLDMEKSCSIIKKNSLLVPEIDYVLAPKKQLGLGITPNEIICTKDLDLVFKSTDNYPACVKPESIPKLIERGWGFILPKK